MKTHNVDLLILTNLPSFYKINLYNEIATKKKILVIFTGNGEKIRNENFSYGVKKFPFLFLHKKRHKALLSIIQIINKLNYNKLIIGGWDSIEMWACAFCSKKEKNAVVIESSYLESSYDSIKGYLKKLFLKRISIVYASGKAQKKLAEELDFKGEIIITKGVGLFNIVKQPIFQKKEKVKKFLYVGRLSREKNLHMLIETFNKLKDADLNIVGYGPIEKELMRIANANINFLGAIDNQKLPSIYQIHDVFILPSLREPWGLVVEEALNNGLPVIVSNKVGCIDEVVKDGINGIIFEIGAENALIDAINKIMDIEFYNKLRLNISKMNFEEIKQHQINCYL